MPASLRGILNAAFGTVFDHNTIVNPPQAECIENFQNFQNLDFFKSNKLADDPDRGPPNRKLPPFGERPDEVPTPPAEAATEESKPERSGPPVTGIGASAGGLDALSLPASRTQRPIMDLMFGWSPAPSDRNSDIDRTRTTTLSLCKVLPVHSNP